MRVWPLARLLRADEPPNVAHASKAFEPAGCRLRAAHQESFSRCGSLDSEGTRLAVGSTQPGAGRRSGAGRGLRPAAPVAWWSMHAICLCRKSKRVATCARMRQRTAELCSYATGRMLKPVWPCGLNAAGCPPTQAASQDSFAGASSEFACHVPDQGTEHSRLLGIGHDMEPCLL